MPSFTALYDACVLYPAPLRDLLIGLAKTQLFRARWTETIHEEWTRAVLRQRPEIPQSKLDRTRCLMDSSVEDCLVTGFEPLIEGLSLPDVNDRHVLAAAIRTRASVIVTFNLKDFPCEYLAQFGVEAQHPDEFVLNLLDLGLSNVCEVVKKQRQRLKNPPKSADELLASLGKRGLFETVARLAPFRDLL